MWYINFKVHRKNERYFQKLRKVLKDRKMFLKTIKTVLAYVIPSLMYNNEYYIFLRHERTSSNRFVVLINVDNTMFRTCE